MEQIKKTVVIDLAEYGMEGVIEMRKPGPRRLNQLMNDASSYMTFDSEGRPVLKDNIPFGDIQVASILRYTYKAPYALNKESFWEFMDTVEEFDVDKANALYKRLTDGAAEVAKDSPFANSQQQGTATSE